MAAVNQLPDPFDSVNPVTQAFMRVGEILLHTRNKSGRVGFEVWKNQQAFEAGDPPIDAMEFGFPIDADRYQLLEAALSAMVLQAGDQNPDGTVNVFRMLRRFCYEAHKDSPQLSGSVEV